MKNKNKFLVSLAITALSFISVSAQFSGGNGTEGNPYIITTPEQLSHLATLVNEGNTDYDDKYYKLGNDLDLSEYGENYNDGGGWIPIGNNSTELSHFKGVFDGDNYVVSNLRINILSFPSNIWTISTGLFGYIENGTIKNLGVVDVNISSAPIHVSIHVNIGALVGLNIKGNIYDCYSKGNVSAYSYFFNSSTTRYEVNSGSIGGIVGKNRGNVLNCYSLCSISNGMEAAYTGGITGSNHGNISNSFSTGTVYAGKGYDVFAGGITGVNYGNVFDCFSTGSLSAKGVYSYIGGVVGNNYSIISNCYSTCSVDSYQGYTTFNSYRAGGVVASNNGTVSNCAALNPLIYLPYNLHVESDAICCGSVVGFNSGAVVNAIAFNNMIFDGTQYGDFYTINSEGEDISAYEIWSDGTLGGRFSIENGWTTENGKLPGLFGNTVEIPEHLNMPAPPTITTQALQNGIIDETYNQTLETEGYAPITWTVISGVLPTGLEISGDGVISGTPTVDGNFCFTVRATNDGGYDEKELCILIDKAVGVNKISQSTELLTYVHNGFLYIKGLMPGEKLSVYNLSGVRIYENISTGTAETHSIESLKITKGIYIIKSENRQIKIVF